MGLLIRFTSIKVGRGIRNQVACRIAGEQQRSKLASLETTALDSELLECQSCGRAYEVKHQPDGSVRLVAV
jgi:hypothetical protein